MYICINQCGILGQETWYLDDIIDDSVYATHKTPHCFELVTEHTAGRIAARNRRSEQLAFEENPKYYMVKPMLSYIHLEPYDK